MSIRPEGIAVSSDMSTIASLLRQALTAVEDAQVPDDLRGVAFAKAFEALSLGPVASSGADAGGEGGSKGTTSGAPAGSELGRIASKLEIDEDATEATFDLDEGEIRLSVPARKFNAQKSRATKEIALLVAAGRQAAGVEERTEVGVVREVVSDYGKLDPPNFATTIREMDEEFNISGSGQRRRVKVNRKGFERAGQLIKELQGQ